MIKKHGKYFKKYVYKNKININWLYIIVYNSYNTILHKRKDKRSSKTCNRLSIVSDAIKVIVVSHIDIYSFKINNIETDVIVCLYIFYSRRS